MIFRGFWRSIRPVSWKLDELVTRTYTIDEAAEAFEDMKAGKNARGVIVFD